MGMGFRILGSSSSGNCALLTTPGCKVLIDAGFSARAIDTMLRAHGESVDTLDGVFITHEHTDHTSGLGGLTKRRPDLKVFANRDTAQAAQTRIPRRLDWQVFETGSTFTFRDVEVTSFSIPHDAYDPVGFVFAHGEDTLFSPRRKVAWVTDLGYVPQLVTEKIRHVDLLVIEANYDNDMLERDTRRPWSVKQRIKGRHGHLSNTATFETLSGIDNPNWRHVYLAHLSRDCNDVGLVRRTFAPLQEKGRFRIEVVDPNAATCDAFHLS